MHRRTLLSGFALACVLLASGSQPEGKLILDLWDAVYLEGGRAGFIRTSTIEVQREGKKYLRTAVDLQLTVKRNEQVVQLQAQTGTEETTDGRVTGTFLRQVLGPSKDITILGTVKGKQLELVLDGKAGALKPAPWDDAVVGLHRQQSLYSGKALKAGDKFSYRSFEPSVNLVVRMDVEVKGLEDVEIYGRKKTKLLRVEVASEKLEGVQLPKLVLWLDAGRKPLRQDTEIPGLGKITMFRTTRDIAMAPGPEATLTDIGIGQLIKLNKKLPNPQETAEVVFRITVKGDSDAASAFAKDLRQVILKSQGSTFDLRVSSIKGPVKGVPGFNPGVEFTQSSYFIASDDDKVSDLARTAVGKESDPWKKALLIEKWVHDNMRGTNIEVMSTADHVARTLEGDCTEYAMLMTAMCRAQGIPAKTAIGMVYSDSKVGPALAFHMWTEVWVERQWIALDPSLGQGFVGATHVKVTDHSWHDTRALTPLLPLTRVLGKLLVEVISVK